MHLLMKTVFPCALVGAIALPALAQPAALQGSPSSSALPYAQAPLATAPTPQPSPPAALSNRLGLDAAWRNIRVGYGSGAVDGTLDSEIGISGLLRLDRWILAGEAHHNRVGVNLAGYGNGNSAAFSEEESAFQLAAGYAFPVGSAELAPLVAADLGIDMPYNQGVAYTDTPLDWKQTRQALGLGLVGSWEFVPAWTLDLQGAYYPAAWLTLDQAPYSVSGVWGYTWQAQVRRRIVPGIHLGLAYGGEGWSGSGGYARHDQTYALVFTYVPGEGGWSAPGPVGGR